MADKLGPWPDAETVVMAMLSPIARTVTSTPNPLPTPIIRVQRVGGSDDRITDFPRIEIACYGENRAQAWDLSEQCRQTILASRATLVAGVLVDNADTDTPAQQIPYDDPDVRRVVAYYRLAWRRPRNS
ncbi:phage tail termination protein [Amycolatopsis sp. NPDC003865]